MSEHAAALESALEVLGLGGQVIPIRRPEHLQQVHAAVLPGGESTTIAKLLVKFGLQEQLLARAQQGMPLLGTCAGAILLASQGDTEVQRTATELLALMDIAVDRNAYGRQRDSFEATLSVEGWDRPLHGVFIRAPAITRTWGRVKVLARHAGAAVLVQQGHLLAATFHPELAGDSRLHQLLVSLL